MKEQQRAEAVVETVLEDPSRPDGATDIYLIFDGRRIAKRGKPGTLHAMTWISLEPGVGCATFRCLKANLGGAWSSKSIMCVCTDKVIVVMSSHKPAVVIY
jgi:hypothetical protein